MSDPNPYAYSSPEPEPPPESAFSQDVWREGELFVMTRMAILPARCVFTGLPSDQYQETALAFSWPAVKVSVPQSGAAMRHHIVQGMIALGLVLLGVVAAICGYGILRQFLQVSLWVGVVCGFLIGLVFMGLGIAWAFLAMYRLTLLKRTERHLWIQGAHPDFLELLPKWPGEDAT